MVVATSRILDYRIFYAAVSQSAAEHGALYYRNCVRTQLIMELTGQAIGQVQGGLYPLFTISGAISLLIANLDPNLFSTAIGSGWQSRISGR